MILILVDAVNGCPRLSNKIRIYLEKRIIKFKVIIVNIFLIRPLGHFFAVEVNIKLNPKYYIDRNNLNYPAQSLFFKFLKQLII
ncbi:MAG: hypothetical protein ACXW1B_05040 [Nitrososphaeraceae archaeon]